MLRAYKRVVQLSAALGGAILVAVFLVIVWDVSVRALGFQPPYWTTPFTEYAMLYAAMLAAPWLVRKRGHIAVDALAKFAPGSIRAALDVLVCLLCIAVSLLLVYYSADLVLSTARAKEMDIRSANLPRWILFAIMPPCFLLVASEFARLLVLRQSYFSAGSESAPSV